jgi:hypothetical protein
MPKTKYIRTRPPTKVTDLFASGRRVKWKRFPLTTPKINQPAAEPRRPRLDPNWMVSPADTAVEATLSEPAASSKSGCQ